CVFDNLKTTFRRSTNLTVCIAQLACVSALVGVITVLPGCKAKPDPSGTWQGSLDFSSLVAASGKSVPPGAKTQLKLVFQIDKNGDSVKGTFASPDQGANGLALSNVSVKDGKLELAASVQPPFSFSGTISADGSSAKGDFKQGPISMPLTITKSK